MKKIIFALLIVVAAVLLVSCSSQPDVLPSSNDAWTLVSEEPVSVSSNTVGSKVGIGFAIYQDSTLVPEKTVRAAGLIEKDVLYGSDINTAAKNGGIKKISHVDKKTYTYLSFTKVEIIVYGE